MARAARLVVMAARGWALLGGLVLVGVVLLTATSVVLDMLFRRPLPGDFELVQILVAQAAFAFLPWSQIRRGHVVVDLFTMRAPAWFQRGAQAMGSLLMLLLALLLLWRMSIGALDYHDPVYPEITPILGIPVWLAFPPILVSLLLWAAASAVTMLEDLRALRAARAP